MNLRRVLLLFPLSSLLFPLLACLPLIGMLNQPHSGFFYAPYYTNNIFTDPTMPGYQAGLRPEYRVVSVNRQLIDRLPAEIANTGVGGTLFYVWELGNIADIISLKVESLSFWRLAEKASPFVLTALLLFWAAIRVKSLLLKTALYLSGGAVSAGLDYFLVSGVGLKSGFDPALRLAQGDYLGLVGKWSAYAYFPLWSLALASWTLYFWGLWLEKYPQWRKWAGSVIILVAFCNFSGHLYSSVLTEIYNNPNFTIFYSRGEFWLLWLPFTLFAIATIWLKLRISIRRRVLVTFGFILFITGYVASTIFDRNLLPFIGAQWWALVGSYIVLIGFKEK
jgi:hypothetical protein